MSINNPIQYSNLAKTITHLKDPNALTGTVLIEAPADIGKAYNGYKRGGVIEGSEKFRREVMSAAVWLCGIPLFNKAGNLICEKIFKLPMNIDYSNAKQGRDAIKDSINFIANGLNENNLDTSDLKRYIGKIEIKDVEKTIKNVKIAKQAISIGAWVLNCALMGVVLPKLNQKITANKMKKNQEAKQNKTKEQISMDDYINQTKKENKKEVSFKGLSQTADWFTYGINNNNRFRLVSTDVPMIIGRCATARNKNEAFEIFMMDSAAIFFYNYCTSFVEKLLRKTFKTPNISATIAEILANTDKGKLQEAISIACDDNKKFKLSELIDKEIADEIYKQGTNGRFGKINKFVKDSELDEINDSVKKFLKYISSTNIFENGSIDTEKLMKIVKKANIKNSAFYGLGTVASFLGLGMLIPKVAYFITKKITGKDGFVGVEDTNKK